MHVIEIKRVVYFSVTGRRKNAGGRNEGNLHYVIENTWRKNARNRALRYVIENKVFIIVSPLY
jgi:hypothetical protein